MDGRFGIAIAHRFAKKEGLESTNTDIARLKRQILIDFVTHYTPIPTIGPTAGFQPWISVTIFSEIFCLFVCLFVCLLVCLLVCLFVCLLACLFDVTARVVHNVENKTHVTV